MTVLEKETTADQYVAGHVLRIVTAVTRRMGLNVDISFVCVLRTRSNLGPLVLLKETEKLASVNIYFPLNVRIKWPIFTKFKTSASGYGLDLFVEGQLAKVIQVTT